MSDMTHHKDSVSPNIKDVDKSANKLKGISIISLLS